MQTRTTLLLTASLLAALGACTATVQALDDTHGGAPDASTAQPDAGGGPDAGALGGGDLAYIDYFGLGTTDGVPVRDPRAAAMIDFYRAGTGQLDACLLESVAGCQIRTCPTKTQPPTRVSAGTVSIQIGDGPQRDFDLEKDEYRQQSFFEHSAAGTPVQFRSTGDVVPAFEQTVPMPAFPAVHIPTDADGGLVGDGGAINAWRARSFRVALAPAYTGTAILWLSAGRVSLSCEAKLADGTELVVPSEALSRLEPGSHDFTVVFSSQVVRDVGGFALTFSAYAYDASLPDVVLE